MITTLIIGAGEPGTVHDPRPVRDAVLLSDVAREALVVDGTLQLPWSVALALKDALDEDGRREDILRAHLPPVLSSDDVDVLLGVMARVRLEPRVSCELRLRARGRAGDPSYRLEAEWLDASGRPQRPAPTVMGGLVELADGTLHRLSFGQHRLLEALSELSGLGVDRNADLLATDRIKAAIPAGDPGVGLDRFLAGERAVEIGRLAPRLVRVGAGFQVRPRHAGIDDATLEAHYYQTPRDRLGSGVLVARDAEGRRVRGVLTPAARDSFEKLREIDVLSPEDAAHAMSQPEEVFGESLDLSAFSERVSGLGPPVRRAFTTLREIEGHDWWDWDAVADLEPIDDEPSSAEPRSLSLRDPETSAALEHALVQADARGDSFIPDPRGDGFIEVTPGLREAVRQARTLAREADPNTGRLRKSPKLVLQVRENIEAVTFKPEPAPPLASTRPEPPPDMLGHVHLKPHQIAGYEWLVSLFAADQDGWKGAVLADDMGLGKTLQVLAYLSWAGGRGRRGPHLIVAPLALMDNWQREATTFFGYAFEPVLPVKGRDLPRDRAAAAARLGAQRLVLVSYETLRRHELSFASVRWDVMVLDEAQKAKDPGTQIHRVVCAMNARARLAVTGTPVENTLKELWALYHWASPTLLGSLSTFARDVLKPLRTADADEQTRLAADLHARIGPYFIRRLKRSVLSDLPAIHHHHDRVGMSAQQLAAYDRLVRDADQTTGAQRLGRLIRLFAVCAHPRLNDADGDLPPVREVSFPKAERLLALLDDVRARGEKALVFANRHKLQWWLADLIADRYGVHVDTINGEVSESRARLAMIDRFSQSEDALALVLAPRAAGVGLNITAANHVIHYTREWNPAVENQATDRAYRIGQTRDVHVHYLIATSSRGTTVDERLDALLREKRALMDQFVVPMGGFDVSVDELDSK
jgi:hypothetical protein